MPCYVLEMQDSKAIIICYLTWSVLGWDLGHGLLWQDLARGSCGCSKAREWCR